MQVKVGLPENKRELIVWGKIEISKEKRDEPVRGSKISGFHPRNLIGNLNNIASMQPVIVSIENFKTPFRKNRNI